MKKMLLIAMLISCLSLLTLKNAASAADNIKAGSRLFKEKKYKEAAVKYKEAVKEKPDSDVANFNLGTALYKNGEYEEAVKAFANALSTEDKSLESKANYNTANSKYMLGRQKAENDISGAVSLYRESLDYFKLAIELNEKDNDAKYNHELVEKKLKILLDKLKNQKDKQGDKKKEEQKEQQAKNDKSKDAGSKDDAKNQEGKNKGVQNDEYEKRDDEERSSAEDRQDNAVENLGLNEKKGKEMSPEEARMLLESYVDNVSIGDIVKKERGYYNGVLKDW